MYLIQLLLPLYDHAGNPLDRQLFARTRDEIVTRFGGLTAYARAPATGLWQQDNAHTVRDDLVIYEVMCEEFDAAWWRTYRGTLERRFEQEQLVARMQEVHVF